MFYSIEYKNVLSNGFVGKKVVVVGIGNSVVDVVVNVVELGGKKSVSIVIRFGVWIIFNYILGFLVDYYVCRFFFWFFWGLLNFVFELMI